MKNNILYLGDTALNQQAAYLAGIMSYYDMGFDYLNSDEKFSDALLDRDYDLLILSDYSAANFSAKQIKAIVEKGAEVFAVDEDRGRCDLKQLLVELGRRGVRRLLIEGGRSVITSFLQDGLADAVRIYISPQTLGDQGAVSISEPMKKLTDITNLHQASTKEFDGDQCVKGLLRSKGWELPD